MAVGAEQVGAPVALLRILEEEEIDQLVEVHQAGRIVVRLPVRIVRALTRVPGPDDLVVPGSGVDLVEAEFRPFVVRPLFGDHIFACLQVQRGAALPERGLDIPGQLPARVPAGFSLAEHVRLAPFFLVDEVHAAVFVVRVAVDDRVVRQEQGAFLGGLVLDVFAVHLVAAHLDIDAGGVLDGDVVGVGMAAQRLVVVPFGAGEVAQVDREDGVGGQGVGDVLPHLFDAGGIQVQDDVELDVGGVRMGEDPVRVFHVVGPRIAVGLRVRDFFLLLPVVVGSRRPDRVQTVLQHIEAEDLPLGGGVSVDGFFPFEIGVLRVEIADAVRDARPVGIEVAGGGGLVDVPVARLDRVDVARVDLDTELDLGVDGAQGHVVVVGVGGGVVRAQRAPHHVGIVGVDRAVSQHQEKVFPVDRLLLQDDLDSLQLRQVFHLVEAGDGVFPVQRSQGVRNVGQDDHRAVRVGLGRNLDGTLRLADGRSDAGNGLVGDEPAFVVGVFEFAQGRNLLSVTEIVSVEPGPVLLEDEHIEVVHVGLVRARSFCLGADLHVQGQGGTESEGQLDRRAFR